MIKRLVVIQILICLSNFLYAQSQDQSHSPSFPRIEARFPGMVELMELRDQQWASQQLRLAPADLKVKAFIEKSAGPEDISIIANKSTSQLFVFKGQKIIASTPFLQGLTRKDEFPGGSMEAAYSLPIPVQQKMVSPPGGYQLIKIENIPKYGSFLYITSYQSWIIALHRVYLGSPEERRQQRLDSPSADDNAISSGCLNVDSQFYDQVLNALSITPHSYIYIIPNNLQNMKKYLPMVFE